MIDPFPLSADSTTVGRLIEQFSQGASSSGIEDGLITTSYLPSPNATTNPWIRLFRRIHDTYEPTQPFDALTVYGMAAAATFVQALQHAGRNPTRQSIVSAINAGAVNSGGPGLVPVAFSANDHDGYPGAQIGVIRNGALQLSGPLYDTSPSGHVSLRPITATSPPTTF